jgi:hypothetical protein
MPPSRALACRPPRDRATIAKLTVLVSPPPPARLIRHTPLPSKRLAPVGRRTPEAVPRALMPVDRGAVGCEAADARCHVNRVVHSLAGRDRQPRLEPIEHIAKVLTAGLSRTESRVIQL